MRAPRSVPRLLAGAAWAGSWPGLVADGVDEVPVEPECDPAAPEFGAHLDPLHRGEHPEHAASGHRGGHHAAGKAGAAVHALELAQAVCPSGLAGHRDRAGTAAAGPARPEDLLPADPHPEESADPDRDAKLDQIEHVTSTFPDRCFAFDQFGPFDPASPRHLLGPAEQAGTAAGHLSPHPRDPLLPRLLLRRR